MTCIYLAYVNSSVFKIMLKYDVDRIKDDQVDVWIFHPMKIILVWLVTVPHEHI